MQSRGLSWQAVGIPTGLIHMDLREDFHVPFQPDSPRWPEQCPPPSGSPPQSDQSGVQPDPPPPSPCPGRQRDNKARRRPPAHIRILPSWLKGQQLSPAGHVNPLAACTRPPMKRSSWFLGLLRRRLGRSVWQKERGRWGLLAGNTSWEGGVWGVDEPTWRQVVSETRATTTDDIYRGGGDGRLKWSLLRWIGGIQHQGSGHTN